jgi:hypothetical protein
MGISVSAQETHGIPGVMQALLPRRVPRQHRDGARDSGTTNERCTARYVTRPMRWISAPERFPVPEGIVIPIELEVVAGRDSRESRWERRLLACAIKVGLP